MMMKMIQKKNEWWMIQVVSLETWKASMTMSETLANNTNTVNIIMIRSGISYFSSYPAHF